MLLRRLLHCQVKKETKNCVIVLYLNVSWGDTDLKFLMQYKDPSITFKILL